MSKLRLTGLSAVIITKNAESTIQRSLKSLSRFSEVIVYDNGSSDNTINLVQQFTNTTLVKGGFFGFGPTKNYAAQLASNDWILSLDADEVIEKDLFDAIDDLTLENPKEMFMIKRDNYFMGKIVRHSGWGNDWLIRIYNRKFHQFENNPVHEKIKIQKDSIITKLNHSFSHYAVDDIRQFLEKINHYSDIRKETSDKLYPPYVILFKSAWAFFRTYFLRLGILDGWRGLVIAVSNANGVFYKYIKIYAKHNT